MSDYEKLPEGRYTGRATGEIAFDVNDKGTESVLIPLQFTTPGWEDRGVTFIGYLTAAAAPYTFKKMRSMGWTGDSLTDMTGMGDAEVAIEIRYEEHEGKERMKVDVWPNGPRTIQAKNEVKGRDLDALSKRLQGHILQSKQAMATKGAAPARAWTPPPSNGDAPAPSNGVDPIPF